MDTTKKLYRVNEGKMLAGICAGFAEYANMDVTVVRVLWVVLSLFGAGLILYIILIFVIPMKPNNTNQEVKTNNKVIEEKK